MQQAQRQHKGAPPQASGGQTPALKGQGILGRGKRDAPTVKADSKGSLKGFSKADFQNAPGAPVASHGTITVSNAQPDTPLILEEKAKKPEEAKQVGKAEEEVAGKTGTAGEVKTEQRFKTSFTITQA